MEPAEDDLRTGNEAKGREENRDRHREAHIKCTERMRVGAVLKKRPRLEQVSDFFGSIPRCIVTMEVTRGAHYWARLIGTFGPIPNRLFPARFGRHSILAGNITGRSRSDSCGPILEWFPSRP